MTDLSTLNNPPDAIVTELRLRKAGELFQIGNLAEAARVCTDLLKVRPDYYDAIHLLAVIRLQQGQRVGGEKLIARAIELNPKDAIAWNNHGHALRELGRRDEALGCYNNAIALGPDYAEAHFSRGVLLKELGQLAQSLESYDRAIAIKPNYAAAHNNRGNVLKGLGRFAEALISYDQAIAFDPGFADAYNNKAVVLQRLERLDEALAHYDRAIAIKPTYWLAFNNRGGCLHWAKRLDEALVDYDRAIALKPDCGDAFKNRAFSKLMLGRYREGWLDHEWRWQADDFPSKPPNCDAPIWQDQDLADRHLLVFAEQGFGDVIQFARYLNLLAEGNCKKSFLVPAPLLRLIQKSMPTVNVVSELGSVKDIDYQVPLMSLPHRLGTEEGSIPSSVPYLVADPGLQDQWKRRLGAGALKVGIAWSGNPAHQQDHTRSIGLQRLLEAVDLKGVTFVSLQKVVRTEDLPFLEERKELLHFSDKLRDFSDTAALISLLDLVISVDTSIAHLAGALAKPVWTLLPYVPDWRWLLDREDSPWYPTMRLFRQEQHHDWTTVLSRVKRELLQILPGMDDAGSLKRAAPKTTLTKSSLSKLDELSLAIRLHEGKNWNKAERAYRNIIESDPDHFDGLHLLGVLLHQQGRNREAIEFIVRALRRKPDEAVALTNYGAVLGSEGRFDEALVVYDRALKIKPNYPPALFNRARALKELNRNEEALADYLQVIVLDPGNAEAFYNRANLLLNLNRFAEALSDYDRAIALKNGYHKAYANRALVQMKLEQIEPAIHSLTKAIALKPKNAVTWNSRGAALMELGRIEEGIDDYNQAIALNPEDAEPHHNRALAYLSLGRFERGWRDYEWRWETEQLRGKRRSFPGLIWSGTEAIAGKTILLYEEQGLGDTIQFCRYVPLVAEQNVRIVLAVPPAIKALLAGLPGASVVLTDGERLPAFDLHCPLLSLPRAFGTRLETIPAPVQLNVSADLLQKWKSKLGARDRPRVGLAWAGNAIHRNDKNRSIPLTALLSLRELPIQLISLQKDVRSSDQDVLAAHPDILHFGSELKDLAETAALISALDLVISVDTAVAHLAATLGQKTWIMIPFASDWRWLINRNDSPWYPSVRLFRQQARRDWKPVVSMVEDQLKVLIV